MARRSSSRPFQRTDRLGEQIREIVASELERLGDDRLELVTVTAVEVDGSLDHAVVYYSAIHAAEQGGDGDIEEALEELRWPIQQVVNREVRARRTPQIAFRHDEQLLEAMRIEQLLHGLGDAPPVPPGTGGIEHDDPGAAGPLE
jgi:ribosome-binding factor A